MAGSIRGLLRINAGLTRNTFFKNNICSGGMRFLYTENSLGIPKYENARLNFRNQFMNVETTFRSKMVEVCKDEKSLIFTEDLKAMLHLVQKKEDDIALLLQMLEKYNAQQKDVKFGSFIFGPVVMRALYYLNEPDIALSVFCDSKYENLFRQLASYQILMCLLYKHEKYRDIRNVYETIKKGNTDVTQHPRNTTILFAVACYKENTPEVFELVKDEWKQLLGSGVPIMRRTATFFAALALNQDAPYVAVEMLSAVKENRYIDIRCLQVLAFMKMKSYLEIIPILRRSLEYDRPQNKKECYFANVIQNLENSLEGDQSNEVTELKKIINTLKKYEHIIDMNFEDHLLNPIDRFIQQKRPMMSEFEPQRQRFRQRTGLRNLL